MPPALFLTPPCKVTIRIDFFYKYFLVVGFVVVVVVVVVVAFFLLPRHFRLLNKQCEGVATVATSSDGRA